MAIIKSQSGNVFFALFGALALIGILGAGVASFIKGPLTSSVKITRTNVAESAMAVTAQVSVMAAASQANCDADSIVEPLPFKTTTGPKPTGGGEIPDALGTTKIDPWGTKYGYCVWDHGSASCGSPNRLAGTAVNADGQTVIALVSAGPDKVFTTTCRTFAAADANADGDLADAGDSQLVSKAALTEDDIIFTYSYAEASGASGGLWTLKSSDANVATIDKDLEVTGGGTFSGDGTFTGITTDTLTARTGDFIELLDGLKLPDASSFNPTCSGTMVGVIRRNGSGIDMCVGTTWTAVGGGGSGGAGGTGAFVSDTTGTCNGAAAGHVRYNTTSNQAEYCDGSVWKVFVTQTAGIVLQITPGVSPTMAIVGPCSGGFCPNKYGATEIFTVTNTGNANSGMISLATVGNFTVSAASSTCDDGISLTPGATCTAAIQPFADGNYTSVGVLQVYATATLKAELALTSSGSGFACTPGVRGWGGRVVTCLNSTTPDYVINEAGCATATYEPTCTGDPADDPALSQGMDSGIPDGIWNINDGALNTVNTLAYDYVAGMAYCSNLIKDGYSNWYLPSNNEWSAIIGPAYAALNLYTDYYYTSNFLNFGQYGANAYMYQPNIATLNTATANNAHLIRCLRRHGAAVPSVTTDTTPTLYNDYDWIWYDPWPSTNLGSTYTPTASTNLKSRTFRVSGINASTSISVSGSGSPLVSINGATGVTSGTVTPHSTIVISANAPAATGTENSVTINIGGSIYTWSARLTTTNTRKIFVTSTAYNGNLGGYAGADAKCQTVATSAGLTGNWVSVLVGTATDFDSRLPWNWGRLENTGGELIAGDLNDLRDGTIVNAIRFNESGIMAANKYVWTGWYNSYEIGPIPSPSANGVCTDWTSSSGAQTGYSGFSGSTEHNWMDNNNWTGACNTTQSLFCMGPF